MSILEDKEYSAMCNGSEDRVGEEENYCEEIKITVMKKKLAIVDFEEPMTLQEMKLIYASAMKNLRLLKRRDIADISNSSRL